MRRPALQCNGHSKAGIPYEDEGEKSSFVIIKNAALLTSTTLFKVLQFPNAKLFNSMAFDDLTAPVDRTGRIRLAGVMTN